MQPSAAEGEVSCHREADGALLGLWEPFCSGVGERKPRMRKESLKLI